MSKILLLVLTIAAVIYGIWLVLMRRPIPDISKASGVRRRFLLATALVVLLLGGKASGQGDELVLCYDMAIPEDDIERLKGVSAADTLQTVWRTLDPNKGDAFQRHLTALVSEGRLAANMTNILSLAFAETAYHRQRTRGEGKYVTCYKMTGLGGTLHGTREGVLKQIELLRVAREKGTIDAETASKARATLARELEMLRLAKLIKGHNADEEEALIERYKSGKVAAGEESTGAADLIMQMETGPTKDKAAAEPSKP